MFNKIKLFGLYLRPLNQFLYTSRLMSTNGSPETKITVTNDGQTIVCWHPSQQFPYEDTRPIPESTDNLKEEESVLKIQHRIDGQNIFKGSGPDLEEIQLLTHTPKHVWKHSKLKRVVPKPPHPREGI